MLGANPGPAAAIYSSLISPAAQKDAFRALAAIALSSDDEKDIFEAILAVFDTAIKPRNKIAHWIWGFSGNIPDGVLLGKPDALARFTVAIKDWTDTIRQAGQPRPPMPDFPRDDIFVWYAQDFREASEQIQKLTSLVSGFNQLLTNPPANKGGTLLQQLLSEPQIQKVVSQRRRDRQDEKATQP